MYHWRVGRAYHCRRRWAPSWNLFEGFGRGPRVYSDQSVRPGRLVQRNGHRRIVRNVLVQVAKQTQQIVHESATYARRSTGRHWQERGERASRLQNTRQIFERKVRIRRDRGQKDLVFRPRRHRTKSLHRLHQGCSILERNQGQRRCRLPMGYQRSNNINLPFFFFYLHYFFVVVKSSK